MPFFTLTSASDLTLHILKEVINVGTSNMIVLSLTLIKVWAHLNRP